MSDDLGRTGFLMWLNSFLYVVGIGVSDYVMSVSAPLVVLIDLAVMLFSWKLAGGLRIRFNILMAAIIFIQIGIFTNHHQDFSVNPYFFVPSLCLFIISVFSPVEIRNHRKFKFIRRDF